MGTFWHGGGMHSIECPLILNNYVADGDNTPTPCCSCFQKFEFSNYLIYHLSYFTSSHLIHCILHPTVLIIKWHLEWQLEWLWCLGCQRALHLMAHMQKLLIHLEQVHIIHLCFIVSSCLTDLYHTLLPCPTAQFLIE